ncbi:rhodanese-like domain-containing protein [Desulforhopalus sp. 52FAK]
MLSIMRVTKAFLNTVYTLLFITFITLFTVSAGSAGEVSQVSGEIKSGFRVLEIDPAVSTHSFVVYRGDYIKFRYPQSLGQLPFEMDSLHYSGVLFPDPDKAPFYKMKKAGTYSFTLGEGGGSIKVIELIRPNYIEVTADEAFELLNNRKLFILDVRTQKEYEQLHLANTHLIPIQELQQRIGELEEQKHEDIFVYCATGNRSTVAARFLADSGFKRIYNLRYGVYDWAKKGHPYETGK